MLMPLPIAKTQGVKLETFAFSDRSRGRRIDSAAEQKDSVLAYHIRLRCAQWSSVLDGSKFKSSMFKVGNNELTL